MIYGVIMMPKKSRPRLTRTEPQRSLPTTTIITTLLMFAGSAWAHSQGYPNAGQMLMIFGVISAATAIIPMATNDRFVHVAVTVVSIVLAYTLMQDIMVAGMGEFTELLVNSLLDAALPTAPVP